MPINLFAYLGDASATLSVVTDRSQGCASIADGSLEIMVQRRLQHDDQRGVGEPLNETGLDGHGLIVRTTHWLNLAAPAAAGAQRRALAAAALYRPLVRATPLGATTPAAWIAAHKATFAGAAPGVLPAQLHLLTLHSWSPTSLLVRVSHSFETGEDAALSQPATVSLSALLPSVTLQSCVETTLSGNQPLANAPKITYAVESGGPSVTLPLVPTPPTAANGYSVTLGPMEIRTLMCTTAPLDASFAEGPILAGERDLAGSA